MIRAIFSKGKYGDVALHIVPEDRDDYLILKQVYKELKSHDQGLTVYKDFIMHTWNLFSLRANVKLVLPDGGLPYGK